MPLGWRLKLVQKLRTGITEMVTGTCDEESKRQEDRCNKTDEADETMITIPSPFQHSSAPDERRLEA